MQGLHLCADLSGVRADLPEMLDPAALQAICVAAVAQAGLGAVAELFHRFVPAPGETQSGITGVVLLAESHLAVHTWPELGGVTLDVYVCNMGQDNSSRAQALMARLISAFAPEQVQQQALQRGGLAQI
ncbi:adenosylmethionine decarboxylase [Roseateles oligotrophus]|uniref:Adenosylmethionine decarboxylase n=1 Tax=Roseateles oligotrophus TaxID=1769250 RepID=A0ABT2YBB5_9BURK|nr:adenosylmethionine decarboxylase [Roseateles oligotrophus]MCV2366887.1 adenosylmethionine decarboxylase [Roseateles oligotrophus]